MTTTIIKKICNDNVGDEDDYNHIIYFNTEATASKINSNKNDSFVRCVPELHFAMGRNN